MKKRYAVMIAGAAWLCAVQACERVDTGGRDYSGYSDGRGVTVDDVLFTGVEYPEGYDWRKDREHSSVEAELFLASALDWKLISRQVGVQYAVAADSDMHRIVDGHLYEDWSGESETVVSCDGVEQFRFPGRETLVSFLVIADDVYTLGFDRSDGRMNVRRNGLPLLSGSTMLPVSGLYDNSGEWCLTACSRERDYWYLVRNGSISVVPARTGFGNAVDIRYTSRGVVGIYNYGNMALYRTIGDSVAMMGLVTDGNFEDVRVLGDDDNVLVLTTVADNSGRRRWALWRLDDKWPFMESAYGHTFYACAVDGENVAVLEKNEDGGQWLLRTAEGTAMIPDVYRPFSPGAFICRAGKIYLSLVKDDGTASLWMDGRIREYDFNGFIDHLEVVRRLVQD